MKKVKWADLKKACEYLEKNPSLYDNTYPNNCLGGKTQGKYYYKTGDCWNYIKALLWTNCAAAYDKKSGTEHYKPNSDLGDWNGATILAHCYDRSKDMSNIQEGEFVYLVYNGGSHAGIYYGEVNGKRKVCEYTPLWENGCHFSDIAKDGTRSYKGVKYAKWQEHGKMPWVEYPKVEEPVVEPPVEEPPVETPPAEDITTVETDGDADENLTVWQRVLIDIMYAVAKAIETVFPKE